ncbi:MAG: hypothetical protein O7G30_10515 [Proteobacteria bacterium]|nr:hypothetical protein [Pseudomonadota bacterium]
MAEATSETRPRARATGALPWELRLGEQLPLPPFVLGAALTLLLFLCFALEQGIHGFPLWAPPPGSRFPYSAEVHAAAMSALLFGYFVGAYAYSYAATRVDLEEIGGEARFRDIVGPSRRAGLVLVVLLWFWMSSAVGPIGTGDLTRPVREGTITPLVGFFLAAWVFGRLGYFTVRGARTAADAAAASVDIDIWNVRLLDRFGRIGLRLALVWIVGVTLFSLTLLSDPNPEDVPARWPIMVATIFLAVLSLLLPVRGVQRRVRTVKRAELDRLDEALRQLRQAPSAPGPAAGPAPGRMADLLATRAYVADVREWPFDAPTLTRFVLFLLIPLGSWLGGAFVERALAAVLD